MNKLEKDALYDELCAKLDAYDDCPDVFTEADLESFVELLQRIRKNWDELVG